MATWSEMERQLEKYARRVCSAAVGKIRDDLYDEAKATIAAFYDSYRPSPEGEPWYYVRNYKNFEHNSFKKFYYDKGKDSTIYGGIELTPQSLKPVYEDTTQEVFDSVYAGFHGVASMFVSPKRFHIIPPRMVPTPMQRLRKKREWILKHPKSYEVYGKKIAKRQCPVNIK